MFYAPSYVPCEVGQARAKTSALICCFWKIAIFKEFQANSVYNMNNNNTQTSKVLNERRETFKHCPIL